MQALLTAIVTWLSVNFVLPAAYDLPAVRFASPPEIAFLRYGAFTAESQNRVIAAYAALPAESQRQVVSVYDDHRRAIFLPLGWEGETPADLSILVHEMVHHLQNLAGFAYACPQAREKLAYDAQERWLGLFGRSLESEFQINGMTLLVSTECGM